MSPMDFRTQTKIIAITMTLISFIPLIRYANIMNYDGDDSFFFDDSERVSYDYGPWNYFFKIIDRLIIVPAFFINQTIFCICIIMHSFISGLLFFGAEYGKKSCIQPWLVLTSISLFYNWVVSALLVAVGAVYYRALILIVIYAIQIYFLYVVERFYKELRNQSSNETREFIDTSLHRTASIDNEIMNVVNEPPPSYAEAVLSPPTYKNDYTSPTIVPPTETRQ